MQKRIWLICGCLLIVVVVSQFGRRATFSAPRVQQEQRPALPAPILQCSLVDELDGHIQKRFLRAETEFGYLRVAARSHIYRFFPHDTEYGTIDALEASHWQVGFYLIGLAVLGEKPAPEQWQVKGIYQKLPPIKGPLAMTRNLKQDNLPAAITLWDQARTALEKTQQQAHYEFSVADWTMSARPIRAQKQCLQCHIESGKIWSMPAAMVRDAQGQPIERPPSLHKTGDVLGIALYAYRRAVK